MQEQWGWNPGTFEAVGTVGASFVAVVALSISLYQLRGSRRDEVASQARTVSVHWVTFAIKSKDEWEGMEFQLHNDSNMPIRIPRLLVTYYPHSLWPDEPWSLGYRWKQRRSRYFPSDKKRFPGSDHLQRHVRLFGSVVDLEIDYKNWPQVIMPGERPVLRGDFPAKSAILPSIGLSFTDASGRWWTRSLNGELIDGVRLTKRAMGPRRTRARR